MRTGLGQRRLRRWWANRPLRSRLVAAAALAVAVALSGVVGVAYVLVRHELLGQLDGQLQRQAGELRRSAVVEQGAGLPVIGFRPHFGDLGGLYQAFDVNGDASRAPSQQVALPVEAVDERVASGQLGQTTRDVTVSGIPLRMLTEPVGLGVGIQVALPLSGVQGQLHRLALAFAVTGAAALAIAAGLAWLVARAALAPVGRLTAAAERIAETQDLSVRITEVGRDELGRLAASFNRMLDALHGSVRAQRQLVADASHELRTPLTSLRTNVEVLHQVEALPPAERGAVLDGIVGQLEELSALVSDVVDLARGDATPEPVDEVAFDRIVEHAVDRARRHWPQVRFDLDLVPVLVRAAPGRLDRAVANLLDNAAKFSGAYGPVQVSLGGDGTLAIRDCGPGIPEADLPLVFERFYRGDEARGLPGSGLGLAIVAQVAAASGGTISVANAADGGVVAQLRLPVRPGVTG
ncbi:MAG TPA: HAMP domain-containing sensor histidine kinase [Mycobacteriales bacterium]|nr:HAMP domain-containing sensor histidine kinase [Mycobacteriales bacterium]